MVTQQTYKFRFYLTAQQKRQLAIEFGHARWVWNWGLELRNKAYEEHEERLNYITLSGKLTEIKKTEYSWLGKVVASCHTQKLINLDKAFKNFFDKRAKYPHFKKRHQSQSVRYQLDQRHVEKNFNAESKLLKLPKLGQIKLKWSRPIEGAPKMVTVSKDPCRRYFVSMVCEGRSFPLVVGAKECYWRGCGR
jgi:putative transposase